MFFFLRLTFFFIYIYVLTCKNTKWRLVEGMLHIMPGLIFFLFHHTHDFIVHDISVTMYDFKLWVHIISESFKKKHLWTLAHIICETIFVNYGMHIWFWTIHSIFWLKNGQRNGNYKIIIKNQWNVPACKGIWRMLADTSQVIGV